MGARWRVLSIFLIYFYLDGALRDGDAGGCVRLSVRSLFGGICALRERSVFSLFAKPALRERSVRSLFGPLQKPLNEAVCSVVVCWYLFPTKSNMKR